MKRFVLGLACWLAALCGLGQSGSRATVILGAGRAGNWDTQIGVTNTDFHDLDVVITRQFDRSTCPESCTDYASVTIPFRSTFVLPGIPDSPDTAPSALYVLSSETQAGPAVSAFAYDSATDCGRVATLAVMDMNDAFNAGDLFFTDITREWPNHANLLLTIDPRSTRPTDVGVEVFDAAGNVQFAATFAIPVGSGLSLEDVVGLLGIDRVLNGSIRLTKFPYPNVFDFTPYAATVTAVEPGSVHTVSGRRNRIDLQ